MMKWLNYLLLAVMLIGTGEQLFAQKIRFPTNVRYIGGGYTQANRPYFSTLEAALNDVKSFATSDNPYVFWIDSDSLWVADWDSVFTESGLTMKDSIDVYYVATGKIKWAGFGFGGGGSGSSTPISTPTGTTLHYDFWTWTGQSNLAAWQTRIAEDIDSVDQRIWELIVYTDSVYLYIENDTLKFRAASVSFTGWDPDTTTVLRTTGNQSKTGTLTITSGGIVLGAGSILQLPPSNSGSGYNIWRTSGGIWYYTGSDTTQLVMLDLDTGQLDGDDIIGWDNLDDATKDTVNAWKTSGTAYTYLTFDSTYTPDVTNGTPIRFAPGFTTDGRGMTVTGDSVQIDTGEGGDFFFLLSMTLDVASTDDYQLDIQIDGVSVHTSTASGAGAGNYVSWASMHYGDVDAESWISFYIDNLIDNDDPNITDINIYIYRIHQ